MHRSIAFALATVAGLLIGLVVVVAGRGGDEQRHIYVRNSDALTANIGNQCAVQFRRDLLGRAADTVISPTVTTDGGSTYAIRGVLAHAPEGWVVVDAETRQYHIPRDTILLIEIEKGRGKAAVEDELKTVE